VERVRVIKMDWVIFEGSECPKCGGECLVLTASNQKNWIYQDDEAKCQDCGLTGYAECDGEIADIIWDDEEEASHE
jgi:hypothetical protein